MLRYQCANYLIKGNICKHIHVHSRNMLQPQKNNGSQHREESAEVKQNMTVKTNLKCRMNQMILKMNWLRLGSEALHKK